MFNITAADVVHIRSTIHMAGSAVRYGVRCHSTLIRTSCQHVLLIKSGLVIFERKSAIKLQIQGKLLSPPKLINPLQPKTKQTKKTVS